MLTLESQCTSVVGGFRSFLKNLSLFQKKLEVWYLNNTNMWTFSYTIHAQPSLLVNPKSNTAPKSTSHTAPKIQYIYYGILLLKVLLNAVLSYRVLQHAVRKSFWFKSKVRSVFLVFKIWKIRNCLTHYQNSYYFIKNIYIYFLLIIGLESSFSPPLRKLCPPP